MTRSAAIICFMAFAEATALARIGRKPLKEISPDTATHMAKITVTMSVVLQSLCAKR